MSPSVIPVISMSSAHSPHTAGMVALVYGFIRASEDGWSDR